MIKRIHILGASGSGTTTLAEALSQKTGYKHFDTDNYFWLPTEEAFTQKRDIKERQYLLKNDLESNSEWILSGSLCGWGDLFIQHFELVVYLWIPKDIRIDRLKRRERQRYGAEIEPGASRFNSAKEFIEWASKYDDAEANMRSKKLHEDWLSKLTTCPVLKIEGDLTVEERMNIVFEKLNNINQ